MPRTSFVVACLAQKVFWHLDAEPAKCVDESHEHQRHELHWHLDLVTLPDGSRVTAASFYAPDPYTRDNRPDYGLYFDRCWQPPWPHDHIDWPDFGVPEDRATVLAALGSLLARAQAGEQVEFGCVGGHGRTGTALALLAVLAGGSATEAVDWVRSHYCPQAVETPAQEEFVAGQGG